MVWLVPIDSKDVLEISKDKYIPCVQQGCAIVAVSKSQGSRKNCSVSQIEKKRYEKKKSCQFTTCAKSKKLFTNFEVTLPSQKKMF